jgi:hypothetical protein
MAAGMALKLKERLEATIPAVVEDHVRGLHQESIAPSDRGVLQRWIGEHVPCSVRILDIEDSELQGARICFVDGERA